MVLVSTKGLAIAMLLGLATLKVPLGIILALMCPILLEVMYPMARLRGLRN